MTVTRILKLIWFVSFGIVLVILFWVYAALPDMVAYAGDNFSNFEYLDKEFFFNFYLALIGIANIALYFIAREFVKNKKTKRRKYIRLAGWTFGLAFVINLFLIISMIFLSILNSGEKFDYSNFGYLVYFSLGMIFLWVLSLPFVIFSTRVKV